MSQQLISAFVIFALVMAFTPGPNNIMLLSSGVTYGFRRTVPHMLGVSFGFAFMVGAVGFGLATVFIAYPVLQSVLKYLGAAYLIYLAVVIAMSGSTKPEESRSGRPMSFWGAALFQWVNAKGWVMVIGTITAYAAIAHFPLNVVLQSGISFVMAVGSTITWTLFGTALRPLLNSERTVRAFNIVMAVLLLASLYPVFMDA
ncbi:MAG: LysE family translocator [Bradyrhizobium sp.]|jgi:threonine/homoserine/homoserine lactone efflux protein|uniref:LysE family translocator n=1 Tax=Bradyrhizobium sp. TaxID=376 RepID=UPI003C7D6F8E